MNRDQKQQLVSSLRDTLLNSVFVAVIHYRGITNEQLYKMRTALKEKDCNIKIAKNTLLKVAIKDSDLEALSSHLSGPVAIAYSKDPVALAKIITNFAKDIKVLQVKIAYFNKSLIAESAINNLAKLGSLEEVRASFIGKLKGVQSNFVRITNAPSSGLVSLVNNYASSKN